MKKENRNILITALISLVCAYLPYILPVNRQITIPLVMIIIIGMIYFLVSNPVKKYLRTKGLLIENIVLIIAAILLIIIGYNLGYYLEKKTLNKKTVSNSRIEMDENLPGIAVNLTMRVLDTPVLRKKYIFEFVTPEKASASFYLSADNYFNFAITDIYNDLHKLEIPLGVKDGIPFSKFINLWCEAGTASNYSFLRIIVDGHEVKRLDLNHPINMGSRNWKPMLGSDQNGNNGSSFEMQSMAIWTVTKNAYEKNKWEEQMKPPK